MKEKNNGVEAPKTKIETVDNNLQEIESKITAKKVMDLELEEMEEKGLGCSILDRQSLKVPNIIEVHKNREKLRELVYTLPHQTLCWAIQRYDIYDRLAQTKFFEWHNSKKELTGKEYRDLVYELNKDKDGISLPELTNLIGKDEDYLFKEFRAGCGLSVVNCSSYEFVMENYLYVRLIPIVNENNQLTDEIRTQYLLRGNAIQLLAEYWEYDYIADVYC